MIESAGELLIGLLELIDFGTWFGTQPPRVGYRYRVRRPIEATGRVLPTSNDVTAFVAHLPPGTIIQIVKEPAQERTDVDVRVEGSLDGVVPQAHHAAALSAGYLIVVPTSLLPSHCKRVSKGEKQTTG